jgi:predicted phage tail protein
MKRLTQLIIIAAVLLPMVVGAQTGTITVTYTTTAPTTGNPFVSLEWQVSANNGSTWSPAGTSTTLSKAIPLAVGGTYIVRVRAIDALGQAGIWSPAADPNTPNGGAPGACGKPTWL